MKTKIIGIGQTKFGELWDKSLSDLLQESMQMAIADAGIEIEQTVVGLNPTAGGFNPLDAMFTGNMCAGIFSNQSTVGGLAAEIINFNGPSTTVDGACGSGGMSLRSGVMAIEAGMADLVIVNGVEKMTDVSGCEVATGLAAACHEWEQEQGVTFPALNAMIARMYMNEFGLTREELAQVSVNNHEHGFNNPYAHIRKKITVEQVLNAPMVADPLTLFDCSPISDGAATVILCSEKFAQENNKSYVSILGSGQASDSVLLAKRENFLSWESTKLAAQQAYNMSGVDPKEISVIELHDGFSIVQLLALEDLGLCDKGSAARTKLNCVVNPSGGLKSRGHPVGATGVVQVVEVVRWLRDNPGKFGLTHNVGGCGTNSVVHVLKKESL